MPEKGNYGTANNPLNIWSDLWQFTTLTSDPSSSTDGDMWLRTDLDSGDKVATLKFNNNGNIDNIPVFATGTSGEGVDEVIRVATSNGLGYIPIGVGDTAFNHLRFQHNGDPHSFHNDTTHIVTETFNYTGSAQTWTVPDGVYEVTVECWGAGSDADGGYASGTAQVSPGDTFDLYVGGSPNGQSGGWPNGGDGNSESEDNVSVTSSGGGGFSAVQYGGSYIIAAGGGGGSGAADTNYTSSSHDEGGGGAGGGAGDDGGDATTSYASASGGTGGGSGSYSGGNAPSDWSAHSDGSEAVAAGGGGGGGINGGEAGSVSTTIEGDSNDPYAAAGGGGGGDSYVGGVSNASTSVGANSGDGKIEITYS